MLGDDDGVGVSRIRGASFTAVRFGPVPTAVFKSYIL
jgi:hypothetical protein